MKTVSHPFIRSKTVSKITLKVVFLDAGSGGRGMTSLIDINETGVVFDWLANQKLFLLVNHLTLYDLQSSDWLKCH